ncbi:MAG: bifunctional diaminohydroxyphosphoribosylaminopyrimidine deaminase/5-amino-6-(5-phosphoribosylamino)uracil reductase RibD [Candidatus Omnitrophica bacterium]|nr:bifunctional diaminohydroxyphosphoribosylaminopyrimidine deaminase/5-amino-6-(5-phosphoribosylamino)uracil reductase RibD [Candidatus Omnitrophota bacterium]MDD5310316.1 bifunctional diaminohydroxyphosphoribosylaminopyrimidine deaminase/5-amino-6-(5-phosphoribosylamino)uracil reductase RibD [Candidatus Omnitrophota bacterium]MDD5545861.1 bifunctional diaminohydroxyphosphoribosylaminopyrimidine deaminase/5-amino-6-(5-phosphoribosylamino)uracil reductase RibD [Candidatus Omnitrophota bacterium]
MRSEDEKYIKIALELAKKAKGMTSPNPCVGAVIVKRGRIVGSGYHKFAGGPHAEIYALRQAGKEAEGATMYISLEPCSRFGRTPPCTDAIIRSGIKRVVAAIKDPNPVNNGRGLRILRIRGIKTSVGFLDAEARELNEDFIKYITKKMPFVAVKIAQSLDGKIATRAGDSKWITGDKAREFVHKLRSEHDAVMVGAGTVLKDDPLLTARVKGKRAKQPLRVILAGRTRIPDKARIFNSKGGDVVIAATKKRDGRVDIKSLLVELAKRQITSVLIEGGGETVASALDAGVVDKVYFFIAPKIIGGRKSTTSVEGKGVGKAGKAIRLKKISFRKIGDDFLAEGYVIN